jgi:hypothetical protein
MSRILITAEELVEDLKEALELLSSSGPNPLLIESDEFWERYQILTDKWDFIGQDDDQDEES